MATLKVGTEYGVVEFNHVAAQKTGQIYAQLPLDATDFATAACENGMVLVYDIAGGSVKLPDTGNDYVYLHKSAEKEYDQFNPGLNKFALFRETTKINFGRSNTGVLQYVYPRLYKLNIGDTYTTNMADNGAKGSALAVGDQLIPATTGIPTYSAAPPATTLVVFKVVKVYTLPDGNPGVKLMVIKA